MSTPSVKIKRSKKDKSTTKAPSGAPKEKRTVFVQVNFVKLGEINTVREMFDAVIVITSRWRAPTLDGQDEDDALEGQWNPQIYIENVTADQQPKVFLSVDRTDPRETFLVEKKTFRGSYTEVMELWDFPFDVQELSIVIKSEASIEDTVLVDETREMHKIHKRSFMDEQEFYLYKYIQSSVPPISVDQLAGIVKQKKPSLKLTVNAARRPQYFILNVFLLMVSQAFTWNVFISVGIIIILSLTSFGISPTLLPNRLQVCFVLVLTAVTLKNVVNAHLPKISYFTYIDVYMLTMMIALALISCWHGLMTRVPDEILDGVDHVGLVVIAGFYVIFHVSFIGHVLLRPYSIRRKMDRNELNYQNKYSERLKQKTQQLPNSDV